MKMFGGKVNLSLEVNWCLALVPDFEYIFGAELGHHTELLWRCRHTIHAYDCGNIGTCITQKWCTAEVVIGVSPPIIGGGVSQPQLLQSVPYTILLRGYHSRPYHALYF